jgi:hypothetical protein
MTWALHYYALLVMIKINGKSELILWKLSSIQMKILSDLYAI